MADRDTEIREAYAEEYDHEHGAQLIDAGGRLINSDSIRARLSAEHQTAIDAKMQAWFGHTSELAAYDADAVLDLGRHTI